MLAKNNTNKLTGSKTSLNYIFLVRTYARCAILLPFTEYQLLPVYVTHLHSIVSSHSFIHSFNYHPFHTRPQMGMDLQNTETSYICVSFSLTLVEVMYTV